MQKINIANFKDKKILKNHVTCGFKTVESKQGFSYTSQDYFLIKIRSTKTSVISLESCLNRVEFDVIQLTGKDAGRVEKNKVIFLTGEIVNNSIAKYIKNSFIVGDYKVEFPLDLVLKHKNEYVATVDELTKENTAINKRIYIQACTKHQSESEATIDMNEIFNACDELEK